MPANAALHRHDQHRLAVVKAGVGREVGSCHYGGG
jgi:hypothetical protein